MPRHLYTYASIRRYTSTQVHRCNRTGGRLRPWGRRMAPKVAQGSRSPPSSAGAGSTFCSRRPRRCSSRSSHCARRLGVGGVESVTTPARRGILECVVRNAPGEFGRNRRGEGELYIQEGKADTPYARRLLSPSSRPTTRRWRRRKSYAGPGSRPLRRLRPLRRP